jgi:peptidoglycan/LPS O-acetylase OafA/YrhL
MNAAELAITSRPKGSVRPAAETGATRTVGYIPSLNGLRAVSFLLVFVGHAGLGNIIPGGFGVTIFFFLSGFLITTLLRAENERNGYVNFRHFWIRRALRIFPPLYLVLIAATIVTSVFYPAGTLSVPAVAARALQLTNYWVIYEGRDGGPIGTGVYWSLAVEEHFYVLFPFLYVFMQRLRLAPSRQAFVLWGLCALVLLWRCILVGILHTSINRTYLATDTRMDGILFGCALAVWRNPVLDRPALQAHWWKYVIVPAAILLFLGCLLIRNPVFRETARYSIQGFALTFVFIAAIRFPEWAPFRILNWPPLAFLGVLSYSLYLMHLLILDGVRDLLLPEVNATVQGIAALLISVAFAWLVYLAIEKPCARLRKQLTD